MKLIRPLDLTIDSTDVADTTYPAYSAGTTYSVGSNVSSTGSDGWTHEYESLADDNTGNPLTNATWWLDLGTTNRHAMFDTRVSTQTTNSESITVQVTPSERFDFIGFLNLTNVSIISVEIENSSTNLYSRTFSLKDSGIGLTVTDWREYYFGELDEYNTSLIVEKPISYSDADIIVTLQGPTGSTVGVGLMLVGRTKKLGATLYGPSLGITDYSRKEVDEFGNVYLLERQYASTGDFELTVPTNSIDAVLRYLVKARATPYLFDFNNEDTNFDALRIFGWYKDFSINLSSFNVSYCSLAVESII